MRYTYQQRQDRRDNQGDVSYQGLSCTPGPQGMGPEEEGVLIHSMPSAFLGQGAVSAPSQFHSTLGHQREPHSIHVDAALASVGIKQNLTFRQRLV